MINVLNTEQNCFTMTTFYICLLEQNNEISQPEAADKINT